VIHTVGPVSRQSGAGEDVLLAGCYRSAFALAARHDIRSIAFPSISTGAYRFPMERAAGIAFREALKHLAGNDHFESIVFVLFGAKAYEIHAGVRDRLAGSTRER
jgi:O-acetyl-ADP-ribose deacetylase (regulator of RNase III)